MESRCIPEVKPHQESPLYSGAMGGGTDRVKFWLHPSIPSKAFLFPGQNSHLSFSINEITFMAKLTVLPTVVDGCDKGNAESPESGQSWGLCTHLCPAPLPQHQQNPIPAKPGIPGNGRAKGAGFDPVRVKPERSQPPCATEGAGSASGAQRSAQDEILPVALGPAQRTSENSEIRERPCPASDTTVSIPSETIPALTL